METPLQIPPQAELKKTSQRHKNLRLHSNCDSDLGRSINVAEVTQLVWLTGLRAQTSHSPQMQCNQKDTH